MEIDSALAQTQKRSLTFVDGDEGRVVMTNADSNLPEIEKRRKDETIKLSLNWLTLIHWASFNEELDCVQLHRIRANKGLRELRIGCMHQEKQYLELLYG